MNTSNFKQDDYIKVPTLEVKQPIGVFYVGVMRAQDLNYIAFADTRTKTQREDKHQSDNQGIQRELSEARRKQIKRYVESFDATFPNSFIIAVKPENLVLEDEGVLWLKRSERTASIVDGQHRLSGFDNYTGAEFDLIVAIFVDPPIEDQAMIFATINSKQTKVNQSLVYDLFAETKTRSPQKTCHEVVRSLNIDSESPFYHKIKPLGKRTDLYKDANITQAAFIKELLPMICLEPDSVRDTIKRGKPLDPEISDRPKCIFWRFFAQNKDHLIVRVLLNYFNAVRQVFPDDWQGGTSPLTRTVGLSALARLLVKLFEVGMSEVGPTGELKPDLSKLFFLKHLEKASYLAPFTFEEYPANASGATGLYYALEHAILADQSQII